MKTLRQHVSESDTPTNTTAGVDMATNSKPLAFVKSNYLGYDCFEVDEETYHKCSQGKKKFDRWVKYVEDPDNRKQLQDSYHKSKRLVIKSGDRATFIK